MAEKNGGAGAVTLVFKVDLHCQGCAQKVKKSLKHLTGVESVKTDQKTNRVTVVGTVDPAVVKQIVEEKTKKKVEFLSPQPANKDNADKKSDGKSEKKLPDESKKPEEKKSKEALATTVVLKTNVHCDGCATKMTKIVRKCKGVQTANVELSKDQIVIKGTMDMKEMLPYLNVKFKRPVEVLPPPAKKSGGDSDKKPKEDAKPATGGGELPAEENVGKIENVNKMECYGYPYGYGGTHIYNPQQAPPEYVYVTEYGHAPPSYLHAPQMFSDENPNACSIM